MPKKIKEVSHEQRCEDCMFFNLPADHGKCKDKCQKRIILSRFVPNEEISLLQHLDENPELKAKIKQSLEQGTK